MKNGMQYILQRKVTEACLLHLEALEAIHWWRSKCGSGLTQGQGIMRCSTGRMCFSNEETDYNSDSFVSIILCISSSKKYQWKCSLPAYLPWSLWRSFGFIIITKNNFIIYRGRRVKSILLSRGGSLWPRFLSFVHTH